jgi:hypothetical protein
VDAQFPLGTFEGSFVISTSGVGAWNVANKAEEPPSYEEPPPVLARLRDAVDSSIAKSFGLGRDDFCRYFGER